MIVASKVREFAQKYEMRVSSEFCETLQKEVEDLLKRVIFRAKDNKRKTIDTQDL